MSELRAIVELVGSKKLLGVCVVVVVRVVSEVSGLPNTS